MVKKIAVFFADSLVTLFIFLISLSVTLFLLIQNMNSITDNTEGLSTIVKIVCSFVFWSSFLPLFFSFFYIGTRFHMRKNREDKKPKISSKTVK